MNRIKVLNGLLLPPASPWLITFSDRSESRQSQQSVFDANAYKPAGLLSLAIDHLAQEAIVIVIDHHQRGASDGLVEPDSAPAFADVSDLTVKNLDSCSKYAHDYGLSDLVALILSLIRLTIERDWRIRDDGFEAHETYSVFPTKITIDRES